MENEVLENQQSPEPAVLERLEQLFPDTEPDKLAEGFNALMQAHPELDPDALCTDPIFAQYASGRSEALELIYEGYRNFSDTFSQELERQVRARTQRASGAGSARTSATGAGLSKEQAATLAEWNRVYPEYAMSTREYAAMLHKI